MTILHYHISHPFVEFHEFPYLESGFFLTSIAIQTTHMDTNLLLMFFHLIGFGLIVTLLITGWLLHRQYTAAADFKTKTVILSSARSVGLLSPIAILVLLITGLWNMHLLGLGLFDEQWLGIKIVLFAIAAVNGIMFGIRSKKRGMLVAQLAQGTAPADSGSKLAGMDKSTFMFYVIQTILFTAILILTVWKPGRYA